MSTKSLYVGNLPYSFTELDLMNAFQNYGAASARIIEGRGFGFVDVDGDRCDAAVNEMNGASLGGRTITVSEARPREDRRGGGGGGGGGGYRGGGGGGGGRGDRGSYGGRR